MYHITFLLVLLDNVVIYPFYDGELRKHNKSRDVDIPWESTLEVVCLTCRSSSKGIAVTYASIYRDSTTSAGSIQ